MNPESRAISSRLNPGIVLSVLVLPPLVAFGNPAVALLVGGAIALTFNRAPLAKGSLYGKYCLQTAIVLLGFRLNLETVWYLSASYTWGVALFVIGTLGLGLVYGLLLRVDKVPGQLIAAGTAICGGTTIASLSPVIGAKPHETAVTLGLIFLLNVIALFVFPFIGHWFELSQLEFGLWSALAIHDTSSVVATAAIYGQEAADVATTIKLGRTLWLIPLILGASLLAREEGARLRVPVFILLFLLATALGSLLPVPSILLQGASITSKALLVCALFLVGTELTRATLRRIRGPTLWQGLLLWLTVAPLSLLAIRLLH